MGSRSSSARISGPIATELVQRIGLVALGQVHADERRACALAQRIGAHGDRGGGGRLAEAACLHEPARERLEGVDAQLPPRGGLGPDPVLVPVGQEVAREVAHRLAAQIHRPRRGRRIEQAEGERLVLVKIDLDAGGQGQVVAGDVHRAPGGGRQPTEGRTQAALRVVVGGLGPQRSGGAAARDPSVAQREQREEPCAAVSHRDLGLGCRQPEVAHEPESQATLEGHAGLRAVLSGHDNRLRPTLLP